MASIIRVRRSTGINPPGSLNFGELGLTVGVGTANNSGGRVFAGDNANNPQVVGCLLYTSPSPRDATLSRMPSSA